MKIPTITEMRFPTTDEGRKAAYSYIVKLKAAYPQINTELIENEDNVVLLQTYITEYEVNNEY